MKLIVKDYLLSLKEKDELDIILCDLCFQMGYTLASVPKTGNRQYGVDIAASSEKEVLLFVVKQGDINRHVWDSDPNSVRQSMNEIRDSYFHSNLKLKSSVESIKIVVATNGVMDEAILSLWAGYTKEPCFCSGIKVDYEFWSIDDITSKAVKYLFNEKIFDTNVQSLMRKALYFVDENVYSREYYENILNLFFDRINQETKTTKKEKILRSAFLASQMIAHYAHEAGRNKIAISVTEYFIIKYWQGLKNDQFRKEKLKEKIIVALQQYEKWNNYYCDAAEPFCFKKDAFSYYNPVENTVLIYEIIEHLTVYAYYLTYKHAAKEQCTRIMNMIKGIIINNRSFYYTPFDCHIRVVSMLYRLFDRVGFHKDIIAIMNNHCWCLQNWYRLCHGYPSSEDSYEEAVNIRNERNYNEYLSSAFWGVMLQWIALYNQEELFIQIKDFLIDDLKDVTKCTWFIKAEEEDALYMRGVLYNAGDCTSIEVSSFKELKDNVELIKNQYVNDSFSFNDYSFDALEFIIAKYYGSYVQVKRENEGS